MNSLQISHVRYDPNKDIRMTHHRPSPWHGVTYQIISLYRTKNLFPVRKCAKTIKFHETLYFWIQSKVYLGSPTRKNGPEMKKSLKMNSKKSQIV